MWDTEYCGKGSPDLVNYPKPIILYSLETYEGKKYLLCEDCGQQIMKAKKRGGMNEEIS